MGGPANSFSRTQETQTPPESSSQNRIAALIAQRRDVIVRKAEKEERENGKHLDERIKRAARLLRGKEEEEEVGMEESSDEDNEPPVNEENLSQEDCDDDDDVERQDKVDKLLGDLCESRLKSSSSNPRLNALRQKRLKLLLDEDSDSSSSSESGIVAINYWLPANSISPTNALEQSETIPEGPMPGPSRQKDASDIVSLSQENNLGVPESDRICDPKQAHSDEMDEEGASNEVRSSKTSQAKVHFKKLGGRGGGRSFRKRSHDED